MLSPRAPQEARELAINFNRDDRAGFGTEPSRQDSPPRSDLQYRLMWLNGRETDHLPRDVVIDEKILPESFQCGRMRGALKQEVLARILHEGS